MWDFGSTTGPLLGLVSSYQEKGASSTTLQKEYTWAQDPGGRPYIASVTTTLDPGPGTPAQTKSTQTVNLYGNVTQAQVFDFGNLTVPARTYNYTYLEDSGYIAKYIRNRLTSATVTSSQGIVGLLSIVYDNYHCVNNICGPSPVSDPLTGYVCTGWGSAGCVSSGYQAPVRIMHDDLNYGTGYLYRGNVTSRTSLGAGVSLQYDPAGVVYQVTDGSGRSTTVTTDSSSNYSLPSQLVATDGNTYLVSGFSYSSGWGMTSTSGANGESATTTYDSLGRPATTTGVNGVITVFTYGVNTQTATTNGRFRKTTTDGFGRTVRVDTGHDGIIISSVDTLYGPCACSPLGKVIAVSQPYAPGTTPVWTTYTYDSSGRTLTATAPDGASVTRYTYHGNQTTVTDPAGKWKTFTNDAMGNLVTVTEPNPQLGTDTTTYTYNAINQLLTVTMPRSNVTQTRTFQWNGADLTSATNPENGTVPCTYDTSNRVLVTDERQDAHRELITRRAATVQGPSVESAELESDSPRQLLAAAAVRSP